MSPAPASAGQPLRVAFLQASLLIGGAERLVEAMVRRLDRERIEPVIVNLYGPGPIGEALARNGIRCVSHLSTSKLDLSAGRRLREFYAAERIDVVHLLDTAMAMFWAGIERRRSARPPVALAFHSTGGLRDPFRHFVANRSLFPVVDRFVALAESHLEFQAAHFGLARERFELVRSGIDLGTFAPASDRRAIRASLGLPLDAPLAGIVASLWPWKDHVTFVDVAARVHARLPEARFLVVGEGPLRAAVEADVAARGLQDVVLLLGSREDVPQIWRALDVAVQTSRSETLPVSLMEAHACGVPAVSTDVGSIRDVIADGETGYLSPPGDAPTMASRLCDLLADPELRSRMGVAARARAEQRFDVNMMVRAYENLFERLAAGAAGGE